MEIESNNLFEIDKVNNIVTFKGKKVNNLKEMLAIALDNGLRDKLNNKEGKEEHDKALNLLINILKK